MGAQVPGAAFACISKLSDALSVRGDKKYAMRCRKKPRDALSVRTIPYLSGGCGAPEQPQKKKPTWSTTLRVSTMSAYSSTSPPARPGCS
jgi:hypothetical protein